MKPERYLPLPRILFLGLALLLCQRAVSSPLGARAVSGEIIARSPQSPLDAVPPLSDTSEPQPTAPLPAVEEALIPSATGSSSTEPATPTPTPTSIPSTTAKEKEAEKDNRSWLDKTDKSGFITLFAVAGVVGLLFVYKACNKWNLWWLCFPCRIVFQACFAGCVLAVNACDSRVRRRHRLREREREIEHVDLANAVVE